MTEGDKSTIAGDIKRLVLNECKGKNWDWKAHVVAVVRHSRLLARNLGADEEICELSAWLHDIAKIKDSKQADHQVRGANEAERILKGYDYPQDRIDKIKHCIISHSSDRIYIPQTKEAKIVASADALALLDNFLELAHFVYNIKKYSVDDGRQELIKRYKSYLYKLNYVPEANVIAKPKVDAIRLILGWKGLAEI